MYIIDYNCHKFSTKTLNRGLQFPNLRDCELRFQNCRNVGYGFYKEACPLNYKQIGFLCVPYCFSELPTEIV